MKKISHLPKLWDNMLKITLLTFLFTFPLTYCVRMPSDQKSSAQENKSENKEAKQKNTSSSGSITVKGSDTMVILGQKWAENYMKDNKDVTIQVTGGGSGIGIAALINGQTELANASRPMKKKEIKKIESKGWKLKEIKSAIDGLSVYVNKNNLVKELSFNQLSQIFRGKITNWKQVGGKDAKIIVYSRDNSSGTYEFFKEHVLKKKDFSQSVQTLPGTSAIVNAIAKDPNGIGYGGKAYAEGVFPLKIKEKDTDKAVAPTDENIKSRTYPLTRYLYIYTTEEKLNNSQIKKYIDWILNNEGQKIVTNVGYYPLVK